MEQRETFKARLRKHMTAEAVQKLGELFGTELTPRLLFIAGKYPPVLVARTYQCPTQVMSELFGMLEQLLIKR